MAASSFFAVWPEGDPSASFLDMALSPATIHLLSCSVPHTMTAGMHVRVYVKQQAAHAVAANLAAGRSIVKSR